MIDGAAEGERSITGSWSAAVTEMDGVAWCGRDCELERTPAGFGSPLIDAGDGRTGNEGGSTSWLWSEVWAGIDCDGEIGIANLDCCCRW